MMHYYELASISSDHPVPRADRLRLAVAAYLARFKGGSLRDVQIAAHHADPRTTMRYDRARKNLDRHPNYILAAYMASGT
ncbi:MAG TPA: hypothetical protein VGA04_17390 [Streptosporangiaceae bacterium]